MAAAGAAGGGYAPVEDERRKGGLIRQLKGYVERMATEVHGRKVMLVDDETVRLLLTPPLSPAVGAASAVPTVSAFSTREAWPFPALPAACRADGDAVHDFQPDGAAGEERLFGRAY